jgi:hypothetical protein
MTTTVHIADATRDDMMDQITANLDAGAAPTIEIRSGTQPADADTTATGSLLATLTLDGTASFGPSSNGVITLDATPALTTTAVATGTASWARVKDGSGTTVFDGSVGTSGEVFTITSVSIVSGQTVNLTAGTLTLAP